MITKNRRFAVAGLWQETNTFATQETTLDDFREFELVSGADVGHLHKGVRSVIGGAIDSLGDSACFGLSAGAWPSGLITNETAVSLIDRFEDDLREIGSVHGLVLNLHGAMVAEGMSDIETAAVEAARRVLGDVPIVAILDLHANPSSKLLDSLDGVVAYKTFPHVDMYERGLEAGNMVQTMAESGSLGSVVFRKLPLITSPLAQGTADDPMRQIVEATDRLGGSTTSFVTPGFAYSDVSRAGLTIMVNADDEFTREARETLEALTDIVIENRDQFRVPAVSMKTAVDQIKASSATTMLVDVGDNIGGGSDGSSTALLPILLSVPDRPSVFTFTDATVVREADRMRVGEVTSLRFRNLLGSHESVPFEVVRLTSGKYQADGAWMGGRIFDMGPTAVLRCKATYVMVTSIPVPPFHREQLVSQGLNPTHFNILTAKGALAWQDAYGDCVEQTIFVDSPGPTPAFPEDLERDHLVDEDAQPWEFPGGRGMRLL
jgi:microcystin degradation protein MlrC